MSEMPTQHKPGKSVYVGLLLVALSTLMYEIQLTRIFSVTMWYHFAFLAISLAMFGMTVGSLLVYLRPNWFEQKNVSGWLTYSALAFAITITLSFLVHLTIPFHPALTIDGIAAVAATYLAISVPFIFSGICTCLALTRFPSQVGMLYAADLTGAALGCILLIFVLNTVDGPTAVIVIAFIAALAALFFAREHQSRIAPRMTGCCAVLFALLALLNTAMASTGQAPLSIKQNKLLNETPIVCEKWNCFSKIRVFGNPFVPSRPWSWGISPVYPKDRTVNQLIMSIDAAAYTALCRYQGNPSEVEHLAFDVINLAHYLRSGARVLVIGVGGARDIVSALVFKQKSVQGLEINDVILDTINRRLGDFTGHLDKIPRVSFVNDEAVSFVARSKETFDIIQISLIDTAAATAAGAFALTENSIYTVDAWNLLLNRLSSDGILTVSRWYYRQRPAEIYRLTALATKSLNKIGIKDTRNHIIIVGNVQAKPGELWPDGVGTILISKQPFSKGDIATVTRVAHDLQFDLVLTPDKALDTTFAALASTATVDRAIESHPLNLTAPTDDSPYFFQVLRLGDFFKPQLWEQGVMSFNSQAIVVLASLLLATVILTGLCIVFPLLLTTNKASLAGSSALLSYFIFIGLGFMLVEMSQMQRLIIFLGKPVYGLSVVLFTLLLSGGLGSLIGSRRSSAFRARPILFQLLGLLAVLVAFGLLIPVVTASFRAADDPIRILVASGMLMPLGFVLGMCVPNGIRLALERQQALTPWLWGLNGAASVLASVASVALALSVGINATYWTGVGCYVLAVISLAWYIRARAMYQS